MKNHESFLKKDNEFVFDEKKNKKKVPDEIRAKMDKKYGFSKEKDTGLKKINYEKKPKGSASGEAANARKLKDDYHTTIEVRGPDTGDTMGKVSKEKRVYQEGTYDTKLDAKGVDAKTKKGKATVEEKIYRERKQ